MIAVGLGLVLGAAFALGMLPAREGYVDRLMSGAAMGIPLWGLISVIGIPLLSGTMPEWGAAQMRTHLPALVGWIMYGASVSILIQGCDALVARIFGAEKEFTAPVKETKHVLILGGGFGGMKTAERLEEELSHDPSVAITLVSATNALLFTPMLAEVAGGSLEPNLISTPLRGSLHRTVVVRGWLKRSILNCPSLKSLAARSRTTNSYSLWARCRTTWVSPT
jgi:NADH dehydrogenase